MSQDEFTKLPNKIKGYRQEMKVLTQRLERMERWIHEIAEKTGVKLSPL